MVPATMQFIAQLLFFGTSLVSSIQFILQQAADHRDFQLVALLQSFIVHKIRKLV